MWTTGPDMPSPHIAPGKPPFFVIGTGRCGSSLLRRLLRLHPDLVVPNETHWIALLHDEFGFAEAPVADIEQIVRSLRTGRGVSILDRICKEEDLNPDTLLETLIQDDTQLTWQTFHARFGALLTSEQNATQWGDKTPDYGFCIDALAQAWPEARFIHLVRDGRDVALSMARVPSFQQLAASGHVEWKYLARQDPDTYQRHEGLPLNRYFEIWLRRIRASTDQLRLLAAERTLSIRYEDLLARPEQLLSETAAFLGAALDGNWLAAATSQIRRDNAAGNAQLDAYQTLTTEHAESLDWFHNHFPRQHGGSE